MGYYKGKIEAGSNKLYSWNTLTDPVSSYDDTYEYNEVEWDFPDFNDIVENFQSEDHYYNVISVGGVNISDYPTYYTEQYKPGEQPILFDGKTKMTTMNAETELTVQNEAVADYNNTTFGTDKAVLFKREGSEYKRVVNYPLWWIPVTDENGNNIKYLRQDRSNANFAGRAEFDGSIFTDKRRFLWGENIGIAGLKSGARGRIATITRNGNFTYSTGKNNTFYRTGEQTGQELYAQFRFNYLRQDSGFTDPGGNPLWNYLQNPLAVKYVDGYDSQTVASIQKQPDTIDKTIGLTGGYNIWTRANSGIALDTINKMAWWVIPDMLQYQDPQNLDMTIQTNRERALYSRIVMQPIVGLKYDNQNTYTNSFRNAYDIILDVFFDGEEPEKEAEESYDDEELELPENKGGNGTYQRSMQTDDPESNPAMAYSVENGYTNIYVMEASTLPNEPNRLIDYNQSWKVLLIKGLDSILGIGREMKLKLADMMKEGALRLYALPVGMSSISMMSEPENWFVGGLAVGNRPLESDFNWQAWWRGDSQGRAVARRVTVSEIESYVEITTAFARYYDTFADYVPYTEATIYLPYIGWRTIPLNDLYGFNQIFVHYKIAVLTGAVVCSIEGDGVVLDTWTGNCAVDIPMTQTDITGILGSAYNEMTRTLGKIGGAVIGGIAGGAAGVSLGANVGSAVGETMANAPEGNGRIDVNTTNPTGLEGFMLPQKVYVTFHRANIVPPENLRTQKGETLFAGTNIRNLHGYTEIAEVQLKCSATNEEKDEIVSLLRGGVILP